MAFHLGKNPELLWVDMSDARMGRGILVKLPLLESPGHSGKGPRAVGRRGCVEALLCGSSLGSCAS